VLEPVRVDAGDQAVSLAALVAAAPPSRTFTTSASMYKMA
jgi:hypothetical protein